jgi:phosphatidylglycerophosphate synthase
VLGARLGHVLDIPLRRFALKITFNPNFITLAGFIITVYSAYVITFNMRLGGIIMLFGGLFDMLDGIVARANGKVTLFGAFLDSVLDRYADAVLFLSVAWYLAGHGSHAGALLSLGTLIGAFLISYARARAEGLGKSCHTGLMERPERILLLVIGTITGWIIPVLWIMLVLTHVTVLQRIYHTWRAMRE